MLARLSGESAGSSMTVSALSVIMAPAFSFVLNRRRSINLETRRMNQTLPLLFGFATTPLELISFLLSAITVALNIRQLHWAWLFAILSSGLYALVFFDARLYGDMGLQFMFILISLWGWSLWLRKEPRHGAAKALAIARLGWSQRVLCMLAWGVGFVILAWFLKTFTDTDVPYADGFLTAGSLLGQVLLSRKKLDNWHVWIIVDILYVGLYVYKNLMLTAILYALFVLMAIMGLRVWSKQCQA
jgi:nicotinamide mononucleotide transporter